MEGKFGKTSESFKILWNDCRKEADEFQKKHDENCTWRVVHDENEKVKELYCEIWNLKLKQLASE